MRTSRSRMLGLATAVAAVSLGAAAIPAQAADMKLSFDVADSVQIPTQPATAGQFGENLHLRVGRTGTTTANDAKVIFDTSGLAGVATLSVPGCDATGTTVTCPVYNLNFDSINITQHPWLSAVAGAKPGSSGVLHVTATASNADSATKDIRVDVGGPSFTLKGLDRLTGVKPGSTTAPVLEFANSGDVAATKVVIEMTAVSGLEFRQRPSNCEFADEPSGAFGDKSWPGSSDAVCTLDATIAPGEVYTVSPLQLGITPSAYYTFADIKVHATEDAADSQIPQWRKTGHLQHGTGPALTLTKSSDPVPTHQQYFSSNSAELEVSADNTADFAALGAWAPAADGKSGKLTVGEQNAGPASILDRSGGEGTPSVRVVFPDGVTVTAAPTGCQPVVWENGKKNDKPNKYDCAEPWWVPTGFQKTYEFGLAVTSAQPSVQVSLQNTESLYGQGHASAVMAWDHNPANDLVTVALGSKPSGGIPAPSPTPTSTSTSTSTGTATTPPPAVQPTATPTHPGQTPSGSASASASSTARSGLAFTGTEGIGTMVGIGLGAVALGGGVIAFTARRRKAGAHQ